MTLESSITLEDVLSVVGSKRVPLAPELAGYLALEIAEGAGTAGGDDIDPRQVYIGDEGTVALVRLKREGEGSPERAIRAILQQLLDASGSQTPALGAAARRPPGGGVTSLTHELEAALIPVNRAAGRRALARLAREVKRVTLGVGRNASVPASERGSRAPASGPSSAGAGAGSAVRRGTPLGGHAAPPQSAPSASPSERPPAGRDEVDSLLSTFEVSDAKPDLAVSRDLKAMAGLDPTPPPPEVGEDGSIESLLAMTGVPARAREPMHVATRHGVAPHHDAPPAAEPPPPSSIREPARRQQLPSYGEVDDRAAKTAPSTARIQDYRQPRAPKMDRILTFALLILLALGVGLVWMLKPGFFTGRTPEKVAQEKADAERAAKEREAARLAAQTCKTTLTVTNVPENAEVLLRVGQAPTDIEHMPVGARLEFVATAEGFAPKRTVVPAKATWDPGPDGKPRFEVAVQLDPSKAKGNAIDPWPPGEPGTEVGGRGSPGTVHVVSTPRGAEIWLLAGLGPEAVIEQLPCKGDIDVLVAGPTTFRKRLHVKESDFAETRTSPSAEPIRSARVSAK